MLCGGSGGVQCNSTDCCVFPELWSAGQPVKCNLTGFCLQPSTPIPDCTPWCFRVGHQWSCICVMTALQPTGKPLSLHFEVTSHHSIKCLCPVVASLCSLRWREVFHHISYSPYCCPSVSSSLVSPHCLGLNGNLNLFVFSTTRIGLGGQSGPMEENNVF